MKQQATNWGVIDASNPITINFTGLDLTKNFTQEYTFSTLSTVSLSSQLNVTYSMCQRGCGNPAISYNIIADKTSIIGNQQAVLLTPGSYVMSVKGTGFGSGNSASYIGHSTFISPVPEPGDYLLMIVGSLTLMAAVWFRKRGIM